MSCASTAWPTAFITEELPRSAPHIRPDGDRHWLLSIDVCSYMGVGRFVLGLFENIEVLGGEGFREYVARKVGAMKCPGGRPEAGLQ